MNFAFSFLFGVLSGCSNVVRLPSKEFPQVTIVCGAIRRILQEYPEIEKRTAFVKYPAESEATGDFCKNADVRIIWGGDDTISKIRSFAVKPRCIDVCFADRYSICVMDGKAILAAGEADLSRLVNGFYNDTYLMDQNACSSPHLIIWKNDCKEARQRFWDAVYDFVRTRYEIQAAVSVEKYLQLCCDAIDVGVITDLTRRTNLLYRLELSALKDDLTKHRGKGGYFYEIGAADLNLLCDHVNEKYQTVTYYGIDKKEIADFVLENRLRGIDRIVPVGKAMDMGIVWDGFDLVRTLSRVVHVE